MGSKTETSSEHVNHTQSNYSQHKRVPKDKGTDVLYAELRNEDRPVKDEYLAKLINTHSTREHVCYLKILINPLYLRSEIVIRRFTSYLACNI